MRERASPISGTRQVCGGGWGLQDVQSVEEGRLQCRPRTCRRPLRAGARFRRADEGVGPTPPSWAGGGRGTRRRGVPIVNRVSLTSPVVATGPRHRSPWWAAECRIEDSRVRPGPSGPRAGPLAGHLWPVRIAVPMPPGLRLGGGEGLPLSDRAPQFRWECGLR